MSDETGTATYLNRAWREFRGEVPTCRWTSGAAHIHPADRERYTS